MTDRKEELKQIIDDAKAECNRIVQEAEAELQREEEREALRQRMDDFQKEDLKRRAPEIEAAQKRHEEETLARRKYIEELAGTGEANRGPEKSPYEKLVDKHEQAWQIVDGIQPGNPYALGQAVQAVKLLCEVTGELLAAYKPEDCEEAGQ